MKNKYVIVGIILAFIIGFTLSSISKPNIIPINGKDNEVFTLHLGEQKAAGHSRFFIYSGIESRRSGMRQYTPYYRITVMVPVFNGISSYAVYVYDGCEFVIDKITYKVVNADHGFIMLQEVN